MRSRSRPFEGLLLGLGVGLCFSAVVGIIGVIEPQGSLQARYDLSIVELISVYIGSGIVGGGIVGALLPLARWRIGAAVIGGLAMLPMYLGVTIAMNGMPLAKPDWAIACGLSIFVGGFSGLYFWKPFLGQSEKV